METVVACALEDEGEMEMWTDVENNVGVEEMYVLAEEVVV